MVTVSSVCDLVNKYFEGVGTAVDGNKLLLSYKECSAVVSVSDDNIVSVESDSYYGSVAVSSDDIEDCQCQLLERLCSCFDTLGVLSDDQWSYVVTVITANSFGTLLKGKHAVIFMNRIIITDDATGRSVTVTIQRKDGKGTILVDGDILRWEGEFKVGILVSISRLEGIVYNCFTDNKVDFTISNIYDWCVKNCTFWDVDSDDTHVILKDRVSSYYDVNIEFRRTQSGYAFKLDSRFVGSDETFDFRDSIGDVWDYIAYCLYDCIRLRYAGFDYGARVAKFGILDGLHNYLYNIWAEDSNSKWEMALSKKKLSIKDALDEQYTVEVFAVNDESIQIVSDNCSIGVEIKANHSGTHYALNTTVHLIDMIAHHADAETLSKFINCR